MPTELPDSAKVLRNDVGKRMATALEAIAQGGGGSAKIEEMTQAEYDALTPAQKADGTLRAISDGQTKIQDIDNVNITTSDNGKLLGVSVSGSDISVDAVGELFKRVQFANSASITVPANGAVNITANDMKIITPTGYTPVAISSLYSSSNSVVMRSFNCFATGTASFGVARNVSGSSESVIFNVAILYIKSGFVSIVNPT